MRKYVALSKKNLAKVWAWAEQDETDDISTHYMDACLAIGTIDKNKSVLDIRSG